MGVGTPIGLGYSTLLPPGTAAPRTAPVLGRSNVGVSSAFVGRRTGRSAPTPLTPFCPSADPKKSFQNPCLIPEDPVLGCPRFYERAKNF